jgi:hypothetical protein
MAALCEISVLMSRNWLALVGSQCWGCDAHGCNYSAKHQFGGGCHVVSFRASGQQVPCYPMHRRLNYIPQIPSRVRERRELVSR